MQNNIGQQLLDESQKQTKLLENLCLAQREQQKQVTLSVSFLRSVSGRLGWMLLIVFALIVLQVVGCFLGEMGEAMRRMERIEQRAKT